MWLLVRKIHNVLELWCLVGSGGLLIRVHQPVFKIVTLDLEGLSSLQLLISTSVSFYDEAYLDSHLDTTLMTLSDLLLMILPNVSW